MKNKIHTLNFALLLFIFAFASPMLASEYYVDKNHSIADDQNTGAINQPWKTIAKANEILTAGDTVYIKAGTYTASSTNYISPVNSGTNIARITYSNYGTDVVTITSGDYGVLLDGDSYITVTGIIFDSLDHPLYIRNNSDYNIIASNTFNQQTTLSNWFSSRVYAYSDHNWIHDNTFSRGGECADDDNGMVLELGYDDGGAESESTYNLLENNTFFFGGHHVLGIHGRYNVVRNNYFHNEEWSNGKGNRALAMFGTEASGAGKNLIEGNRIGYSGVPCDDTYVTSTLVASSDNIFRYNMFYHNNANAIAFASYNTGNVRNNVTYNNTFFNNCDTALYPSCNGNTSGDTPDTAIHFADWTVGVEVTNNIFKNNLYFEHFTDYTDDNGADETAQIYANEFNGDVSGDPLFTNASTTRPGDLTDSSLPDFTLQIGSPAQDAGGALTTVSSGCSSSTTQIVLADASYFQDGSWGVASVVLADEIAVGTVSNSVLISSISGYTVNLDAPISCTNADNVWLYKDSDGTQVLLGLAPDAGANEYGLGTLKLPKQPQNLTGISTPSP